MVADEVGVTVREEADKQEVGDAEVYRCGLTRA